MATFGQLSTDPKQAQLLPLGAPEPTGGAFGANVNAVDNQGGTPLHVAATRGSLDVAKVLIAAGAKNLRNKQNQLPIDLARSSSGNDPAGLTARAELLAELSRLLVPAIRCSRVP